MDEQQTLFLQTIECPNCGESLFSITELNAEKMKIKCRECGQEFHVFGQRAGELLAKTLKREQKRQDKLTLGELLEIKLHGFEVQTGSRGEGAAMLFQEYVTSLFDGVIESVDDMILKRLRKRLFNAIKNRGMGDGGKALEEAIEKSATWALQSAGYALVDNDED